MAYLADEKTLAVFLDPPTAYFVDPLTLEARTVWTENEPTIRSLCYVPVDAGYVCTINSVHHLRLRSVVDGSMRGDATLPTGIRSLRFAAKGAILGCGRDGAAYLYRLADLLQDQPVATRRLLGHVGQTVDVDISPDGHWLCSGGMDGDLKIWSDPLAFDACDAALSGRPLLTLFSPCGRWLAIAQEGEGEKARLDMLDANSGRRLWHTDDLPLGDVLTTNELARYCAFDARGSEFVALESRHAVHMYDSASGRVTRVISEDFGNGAMGLRMSSDGTSFLLRRAYEDGIVLSSRSKSSTRVPVGHLGIFHTKFGDLWLELTPEHRPVFHGLKNESATLTLEALPDRVNLAATSADGRYLAMAGATPLVYLFDLENPGPPAKFVGHEREIMEIAFAPNARTLLTLSIDNTLRFWHIPTRAELLKLGSAEHRILTMTLHPAGKLIVLGIEHDGHYGLQIFRLSRQPRLLPDFDPTTLVND